MWVLDFEGCKLYCIEPALTEEGSKTLTLWAEGFSSNPQAFGYKSSSEIYVQCSNLCIDKVTAPNVVQKAWFQPDTNKGAIKTGESIDSFNNMSSWNTYYNLDMEYDSWSDSLFLYNQNRIIISSRLWGSANNNSYMRNGTTSITLGSVILGLINNPKISFNVSGVRKYFDVEKYISERLGEYNIYGAGYPGSGDRYRGSIFSKGLLDSTSSYLWSSFGYIQSDYYLAFREVWMGNISNTVMKDGWVDVKTSQTTISFTDKSSFSGAGGVVIFTKIDGSIVSELDWDIRLDYFSKPGGSTLFYNYMFRVKPHTTEYRYIYLGLVDTVYGSVSSLVNGLLLPPVKGYEVTSGGMKLKSTTVDNDYYITCGGNNYIAEIFYSWYGGYNFLRNKSTGEVVGVDSYEDDKMLYFKDYTELSNGGPLTIVPRVYCSTTNSISLGYKLKVGFVYSEASTPFVLKRGEDGVWSVFSTGTIDKGFTGSWDETLTDTGVVSSYTQNSLIGTGWGVYLLDGETVKRQVRYTGSAPNYFDFGDIDWLDSSITELSVYVSFRWYSPRVGSTNPGNSTISWSMGGGSSLIYGEKDIMYPALRNGTSPELTGLVKARRVCKVLYYYSPGNSNIKSYSSYITGDYVGGGFTVTGGESSLGESPTQGIRQWRSYETKNNTYTAWNVLGAPTTMVTLWEVSGVTVAPSIMFSSIGDAQAFMSSVVGTGNLSGVTFKAFGYFYEDLNISSPYNSYHLEGSNTNLYVWDYGGS
jgi:hypothetical protein